MSEHLTYFPAKGLAPYQNKRANEQHVADAIRIPDPALSFSDNLDLAKDKA